MQHDQSLSAYIFRETLIGGVINAFFSLIFVFIVFAGQATISMAGSDGLLIDSLPQGLAIGLLGSFFHRFSLANDYPQEHYQPVHINPDPASHCSHS